MTHEEFRAAVVTCRKCKWQGTGADMNVGEVHEGGGISEYQCPKCGEYWGAVPWPRIAQDGDATQMNNKLLAAALFSISFGLLAIAWSIHDHTQRQPRYVLTGGMRLDTLTGDI